MRRFCIILISLFCLPLSATVVDQEMEVQGHLLSLVIDPADGGALHDFGLNSTPGNLAGGEGLFQEGFGVGSHYVPNRRLNERFEVIEEFADRPVIEYSYDCDGPNIRGLHVVRRMEPMPDEASVRVTWTIENKGDERQWVAPWVRNEATPGGTATDDDHWNLPTTKGVIDAARTAYHGAARNWVAATDPIEKETLFAVFHADHTHSFLSLHGESGDAWGFQTAFVPTMLGPGEQWQTTYRVNAVRGLSHVDFASEELAAQIDYDAGKLKLLLSPAKNMPDLQIEARVLASNGRVWRLPKKKFSLSPNRLARCTYDWTPPGGGAYEFIARITRFDEEVTLGVETGSPHGGIDTQFVIGKPQSTPFEPWTDAPFALARGPRRLKRSPAAAGSLAAWFAPALEKVFREDVPEFATAVDPIYRIALARGEAESFQLVLRPKDALGLAGLSVQTHDLVDAASGSRIDADQLEVFTVRYHPVRVPSHFEGPTGTWPDALLPFETMNVAGEQSTPLWFTLTAPAGTPAGLYRGMIAVTAADGAYLELWIEVRVFGFTLPAAPSLKTDFGFWPEAALEQARAQGGRPNAARLTRRYLENALAHRVTLRDLSTLPAARADYGAVLDGFKPRLEALRKAGATTFSAPLSLLETPELLAQANAFVKDQGIADRAFVHLADAPRQPAWPRLLETMQRWKDAAPDIPILVTTLGLQPFIPGVLDIWGVHLQCLDTVNNRIILERITGGGEVWCYVNHIPPRPYGNFFLDFSAVEHRILFWQCWALGMRGMHYWGINYYEPGQDPYDNLLDITPVNGDGLLVYPGPEGPVNSIRWEVIRDGIEDYDYLALFAALRRKLEARGGQDALRKRASAVYNLESIVPDLVTFSRDPQVLLDKRLEIGQLIEEMQRAL